MIGEENAKIETFQTEGQLGSSLSVLIERMSAGMRRSDQIDLKNFEKEGFSWTVLD